MIYIHTALDHGEVFRRYQSQITRIQPALASVPAGSDSIMAIDALDPSVAAIMAKDPDITVLPSKTSPRALSDATVAKLKHHKIKKGDTTDAALLQVYADTKHPDFNPDFDQ